MPFLPVISTELDKSFLDECLHRFRVREGDSLGRVIHVLRFGITDHNLPQALGVDFTGLSSLLLDFRKSNEWYSGSFSFMQTRYGMRYVTSKYADPAAQSHGTQCLSLLAELGYGLDESASTPVGPQPLKRFLDDTIAMFQLEGELEWTALALALYLPPQNCWHDRFGTEYTFDDVVRTLILSPLESASCFGTHRLYTLTVIYRADRLVPILSDMVRESLAEYLRGTARAVARSQQENGALNPTWLDAVIGEAWYGRVKRRLVSEEHSKIRGTDARGLEPSWGALRRPSPVDLVLATGHHIEWLILLPADMQPDAQFFERSLSFLVDSLRSVEQDDLGRGFCPYSHAARIVCMLYRQKAARSAESLSNSVFRF